ncbi:hypothetical protein WDU94_004209 [Cyamophila willieti]
MIRIHVDYQYNGFIWNADDWNELRCHHRIVGNLVGTRSSAAKNAKVLALPCQLLPEEVTLLVKLNICKLVKMKQEPWSDLKEKYDSYKEEIMKEQDVAFKKGKEKKIYKMIDNIVKNKEASAKNGENIDRNQILQEELAKLEPLSADHILVQRFLEDPWQENEELDSRLWTYPVSRRDKLKYSIFKDLWSRKYFITNGTKFGGDYLVYCGDPSKFHAQFIVICKDQKDTFQASELAMYSRIGTNVKKTVVIASCDTAGQVIYQSLSWADLVT